MRESVGVGKIYWLMWIVVDVKPHKWTETTWNGWIMCKCWREIVQITSHCEEFNATISFFKKRKIQQKIYVSQYHHRSRVFSVSFVFFSNIKPRIRDLDWDIRIRVEWKKKRTKYITSIMEKHSLYEPIDDMMVILAEYFVPCHLIVTAFKRPDQVTCFLCCNLWMKIKSISLQKQTLFSCEPVESGSIKIPIQMAWGWFVFSLKNGYTILFAICWCN